MSLSISPSVNSHLPVSPLSQQAAPTTAIWREPIDQLQPRELAQALQTYFDAMIDPRFGETITKESLQRVADGRPLNGVPPTQTQIEIAQEVLKRKDLFQQLDFTSGKDGKISRDDLATETGDFQYLSDRALITLVGKNFNEYGGGDTYVNFTELREAAGEQPSAKKFSPQARGVAQELLKRIELLDRLDIGVGFLGFAGKQDQRFDLRNVEYTRMHSSPQSRYPD
ncbi:hypothetical protein IMF22_11775 [Pseudomonas poae]|uniref:Uncharacterized protein n=1 Tax=Pseudomonas poae TaxID=200451 RepID=A0A7M1KN72_9PSED|nr:hypothetical protein [Pseudomonas poae]QOQ77663.1 hypothetical protein IMF22_11775 [Pseudomonas poae]